MRVLLFPIFLSWVLGVAIIPNPPAGDGSIVRGFDPPKTSYGAGHRGIDLSATIDELVRTPVSGKVHFAGYVVNRPVITIATATILMSFEPVESLVFPGQLVTRGQVIGWIGVGGHCDQICLHVGVRRLGTRTYLDPLTYLLGLPRLLPIKP